MSEISKYLVKRVFLIYILLVIACFLIKNAIIVTVIILTFSILFSVVKFVAFEAVLKRLGNNGNKNLAVALSLTIYLVSLAVIGVMIVIAIRTSIYTFIIVLLGSLSDKIIIMINGISEAMKKQFGRKEKGKKKV